MKNSNSTKNQEIKSKFVEREVKACVTPLIDHILSTCYESKDPFFTYEDIENMYSYPEFSITVLGENLFFEGGTETDKENFLENFDRLAEESENLFESEEISEFTHELNIKAIQEAREEFENLETEPREIFEWWLVSSWLGEKLSAKGQPILTDGLNTYWGRCTTGQAILLDYVITQICSDLEILEGQESDWSK